jgi:hypothetical protein
MEQCGIEVCGATESNDWLSVAVNGVIAEQYSRKLSARMKDVRLWEAKQGWLVGPAPVGYERRGRELVETPQAARYGWHSSSSAHRRRLRGRRAECGGDPGPA